MLYAIVGVLVIILDQWVKFWTAGHISMSSAGEEFIPGILSLANVHNEGAAFGFLSGSGARIPFIILAGVFALVVILALATNLISGKLARWSIVLVTAGGLSNCLDRVIYGYVQDMFKLEFINFPVFNVADIFITVFAIVFALAVIFGKTRPDDDEEDEEFEDDEEEDVEEEPRVSRRKQRRLSRRAAAEEDDDEDDFEEPEPVKKPKKTPHFRRRGKTEEAEEPAPAEKKEAEPAAEAPKPQKAAAEKKPAAKEDPFAAWERANARVNAQKPVMPSEKQQAAPKPAAPAQKPAAAAPAPKRAAPKPAAPAKPAAKPAVEDEFSLEDILNEFR